MGTISVEGTPVTLTSRGETPIIPISISGHLLLIYKDDNGNEFVIRGGPTLGGGPNYGPLKMTINVPLETSVDRRIDENGDPVTPESRGNTIIDFGDRDPDDIWEIIIQHAQNMEDANFEYNPFEINSNGVVGNLLDVIGALSDKTGLSGAGRSPTFSG